MSWTRSVPVAGGRATLETGRIQCPCSLGATQLVLPWTALQTMHLPGEPLSRVSFRRASLGLAVLALVATLTLALGTTSLALGMILSIHRRFSAAFDVALCLRDLHLLHLTPKINFLTPQQTTVISDGRRWRTPGIATALLGLTGLRHRLGLELPLDDLRSPTGHPVTFLWV